MKRNPKVFVLCVVAGTLFLLMLAKKAMGAELAILVDYTTEVKEVKVSPAVKYEDWTTMCSGVFDKEGEMVGLNCDLGTDDTDYIGEKSKSKE